MPPRPCLDCRRPTPTGSRCPDCERARARVAQRARRAARPTSATAAEKRRRRAAVDQWRQRYGDWCPGWGEREPHAVVWPNILTADHLNPVAAGGDERGALTVRCKRCNSARGANHDRIFLRRAALPDQSREAITFPRCPFFSVRGCAPRHNSDLSPNGKICGDHDR
jgi:5-methylcytosine-specific restriction enzyme A